MIKNIFFWLFNIRTRSSEKNDVVPNYNLSEFFPIPRTFDDAGYGAFLRNGERRYGDNDSSGTSSRNNTREFECVNYSWSMLYNHKQTVANFDLSHHKQSWERVGLYSCCSWKEDGDWSGTMGGTTTPRLLYKGWSARQSEPNDCLSCKTTPFHERNKPASWIQTGRDIKLISIQIGI